MNKQERLTRKLVEEQRPDGSFGRFHTMDSKLGQKIPTTQAAAWLMYENAFTRENEICNRTCLYMERLLNDLSLWPDAWEKNKWFKPAVPLFIASSLALFESEDKKYKKICDLWISLLIFAFEADGYSPDKTDSKSKLLLGVEIDGSYIGFHGLNNLALYAFNKNQIPLDIQRLYLQWLHHYDGVIAYTNTRLDNLSKNSVPTKVLTLLSRFDGFEDEFSELNRNAIRGKRECCADR